VSPRTRFTLIAAALLLIALFAAGLLWWGTKWGIGLFGDSVTYISTARDVIAGRGLRPVSQYPPLYPLILTLGAPVHVDAIVMARWVNVLMLMATVMLSGAISYRLTRSSWASIAAALLVATSTHLLGMHARAYSEATFIFLSLAGLAALGEASADRRWLFLSAILIAAATTTRYAGVCLLMTGVLVMMLGSDRTTRSRLIDICIFSAIVLAPAIVWILRNRLINPAAAPRPLATHPPTQLMLMQGWETIAAMALPTHMWGNFGAAMVLIVAFVVMSMITLCSRRMRHSSPAAVVLVVFVLLYVPFLLFARTFFEANLPLNYRLLCPIYPPVFILVVYWFAMLARWKPPATAVTVATLGVMICGYHAKRAVDWSIDTRHKGLGYASPAWKHSPTIAAIRDLPFDDSIFSNAPDAIYILANRDAQPVPRTRRRASNEMNANVSGELSQLAKAISGDRGVVIFFNTLRRADFLISEDDLQRELPLECVQKLSDGRIYRLKPAPATTQAAF
jgi:4-amino-4-deoxy-L-arabinose transferase-like glycosyltransferase